MLKGIRWLARFAVARAFFRGVRAILDEIEEAVRDADEEAEVAKPERPWKAAPGRLRPEDIVPGRHVWRIPLTTAGPCAHGVVEADGRTRWLPHGAYWERDFYETLSIDEAGRYVVLYESEEAARNAPEIERRGEDACR